MAATAWNNPVSEPPRKLVQLDRHTYEVMGKKRGGLATVWLLRQPEGGVDATIFGKFRAVKTFDALEDADEALIENELGTWATLNHPNIVPLIKIARLNFELAAMMELMPGTLADYTAVRSLPVDKQTTKVILVDTFQALLHAQATANIAHLDLKPQNLLMPSMERPNVKVSDWGLSRLMARPGKQPHLLSDPIGWLKGTAIEETNFQAGTPIYMAPERFSGTWHIGPAADVFSVGVIAIELLTGGIPTLDESNDIRPSVELIISGRYYSRASKMLSRVEPTWARFILSMLGPKPGSRPTDYKALIAQCEAL
jgi:serine/threonine protein kinase